MATRNIVPRASGEGGIGTAVKHWGTAFFDGVYLTNDLPVALGGTAKSQTVAFSVQCGGTTSTSPMQDVANVGSSGQVLTSNGTNALPSWQAAPTQSYGRMYTTVQVLNTYPTINVV